MQSIHVWLDETPLPSGGVRRLVTAEDRTDDRVEGRRELWFEVESTAPIPSVTNLNAAVCALVFAGMRSGRKVHAHGPVSRQLLANLDEFQAAFSLWMPRGLRRVDITAEDEIDDDLGKHPAIVAFSGGADAAYSYLRHTRPLDTRHQVNVAAVMLVHGFDLKLGSDDGYATAWRSAEAMLAEEEVERIWVKTNMREGGFIGPRGGTGHNRWTRTFGAALASCFHQLDGAYSAGVIGSDEPYHLFAMPWGSNPVTNPLLSSNAMRINYDAGGVGRTEKIKALSKWDAAMGNLRVCYAQQGGDNCGACQKCIRTILEFRALGIDRPACFEKDVTDDQIREVRLANKVQRAYFVDLIAEAKKNNVTDSWLTAAEEALVRARTKSK